MNTNTDQSNVLFEESYVLATDKFYHFVGWPNCGGKIGNVKPEEVIIHQAHALIENE